MKKLLLILTVFSLFACAVMVTPVSAAPANDNQDKADEIMALLREGANFGGKKVYLLTSWLNEIEQYIRLDINNYDAEGIELLIQQLKVIRTIAENDPGAKAYVAGLSGNATNIQNLANAMTHDGRIAIIRASNVAANKLGYRVFHHMNTIQVIDVETQKVVLEFKNIAIAKTGVTPVWPAAAVLFALAAALVLLRKPIMRRLAMMNQS